MYGKQPRQQNNGRTTARAAHLASRHSEGGEVIGNQARQKPIWSSASVTFRDTLGVVKCVSYFFGTSS